MVVGSCNEISEVMRIVVHTNEIRYWLGGRRRGNLDWLVLRLDFFLWRLLVVATIEVACLFNLLDGVVSLVCPHSLDVLSEDEVSELFVGGAVIGFQSCSSHILLPESISPLVIYSSLHKYLASRRSPHTSFTSHPNPHSSQMYGALPARGGSLPSLSISPAHRMHTNTP